MAITATGAMAQYQRAYSAALTTANSTYSTSPTNTALLYVAGPDGTLITRVSAIPQATVGTANQLQLFLSKDGGTTMNFFSSALMATYSLAQTTAAPVTNFNNADGNTLSPTNPWPLTGMTNFGLSPPTFCGTSSGSVNAQLLPFINIAALSKYVPYDFEAGFTNTGATTLMLGSSPATTVVRDISGAALSSGDITKGFRYRVWYDGSNLRLIITDRIYVAEGQTVNIMVSAQGCDF